MNADVRYRVIFRTPDGREFPGIVSWRWSEVLRRIRRHRRLYPGQDSPTIVRVVRVR